MSEPHSNSDDDLFLEAIVKEPHDWFPRLVFADWLIEQGDPRGEMIHLLHELLQLDCEDRETKQTRYLELYHQGYTIPTPIRNDNAIGATFMLLPPGQFLMGSPKTEKGRTADENQADVILTKGFWIGQTVVTQFQWEAVMETRPWQNQPGTRSSWTDPVTYVGYYDAKKFCDSFTLQEKTEGRLPAGWQYLLPTEAQWEFACRAGTQTRYSFGDDVNLLPQYAWFKKNCPAKSGQHPREVGQKTSNPWGLYDMHGNVWECCKDKYVKKLPGGEDPIGRGSRYSVMRGGGWSIGLSGVFRSAHRGNWSLSMREHHHGFRLVLVPEK